MPCATDTSHYRNLHVRCTYRAVDIILDAPLIIDVILFTGLTGSEITSRRVEELTYVSAYLGDQWSCRRCDLFFSLIGG